MAQFRQELLGQQARSFRRFPLLLKFLDAHEMLLFRCIQGMCTLGCPQDCENAKTEAWIVVEAGKESLIYAGLKHGSTPDILRQSLTDGTLPDHLMSMNPKSGDSVFVPAGTVHSLGGDVVVFEVQQNSDVTFWLYDWGHVDAKTGQPRPLQLDQALACIDFTATAGGLVGPLIEEVKPVKREKLIDCQAFRLWRLCGESVFTVGAEHTARVLVCIDGTGQIENDDYMHAVAKGEVWVLPATIGTCLFRPRGAVTLLEIAVPVTA